MIIVDGPDNVGKTTFIQALALKLGFTTRNFGQEIQEWDRDELLVQLYKDILLHSPKSSIDYTDMPGKWDTKVENSAPVNIIYDRYHMSNFIYGKVIRKSPSVNALDALVLNKHLSNAGLAYTILILPANIHEYERELAKSPRFQDYDIQQNVAVAEQFKFHANYLEPDCIMQVDKHPLSSEIPHIAREYLEWRNADADNTSDEESMPEIDNEDITDT